MVKLSPKTRRDYALLVIAGTFLYGALIVMAGAMFPRYYDRLFYSAIMIPVIFIATALWLAGRTNTRNWWAFWGPGFSWGIALTFVGYAAAMALGAGLLKVFLAWGFAPQKLHGLKLAVFRWPEPSLPVLRSVIGSPVGEEILFRGWMMSWLREKDLSPFHLGKHRIDTPNLLTSLSFAAIHIFNKGSVATRIVNMVLVFFTSLLLGKARNRSGGVLLPMTCHAVINFINASMFVPVPS